jgi:hypothetical protein
MKKQILFVFVLAVSGLFAQETIQTREWKPETSQVGIPVRVFDGDKFVPNLGLSDFELLENGVPQRLNALYLMRKGAVERKDGEAEVAPDPFRRFFILIQMTDYQAKLKNALDYLFNEELQAGDSLDIQTPMREYKLTAESLATKPHKTLSTELNDIIRKDIGQGGMAFNSMLRDLKRLVRLISGSRGTSLDDVSGDVSDFSSGTGLERQLQDYKNALTKMETLREADEAKLVAFARALKDVDGQKYIIYIYQREFRPEISPQTYQNLMFVNQDQYNIQGDLQELFTYYNRDITLNRKKLDDAFADSGVNFNLLFMDKQPERVSGITMREQSEDVFKAFTEVLAATGGMTTTSENPDSGMKDMFRAADQSYMLYFTPPAESKNAAFKSLQVRVKDKSYRIVARAGYF